jgi:hypothetical protein
MEQLIILLLIMFLPGIIRKLTQAQKQQKAQKPAGPRPERPRPERRVRRTARAPRPEQKPEPVAPTPPESVESEPELPTWMQELAEALGAKVEKDEAEEPAPPPEPVVVDAYDVNPEGLDALPGPAAAEQKPQRYLEYDDGVDHRGLQRPYARPARRRAGARPGRRPRAGRGVGLRVPPGPRGWRRAIVLREVLGPPRASLPYGEGDSGWES